MQLAELCELSSGYNTFMIGNFNDQYMDIFLLSASVEIQRSGMLTLTLEMHIILKEIQQLVSQPCFKMRLV